MTYNNELYQCIQGHTSEPNWMPPATPALWQDLGSCSATPLLVAAPRTTVPSAVAFPNISKGNSPVGFFIPLSQPALVQIDIFTLTRQKVAEAEFYGTQGVNTWLWDLRNSSKSPVASGLYVYSVRTTANGQTETKTGKIVILH